MGSASLGDPLARFALPLQTRYYLRQIIFLINDIHVIAAEGNNHSPYKRTQEIRAGRRFRARQPTPTYLG